MIKTLLFSLALAAGFSGSLQAQQRTCATMSHLDKLEKQFPGTKAQLKKNDQLLQSRQLNARAASQKSAAVISIPVVVHVVYNTPAENISLAQIQSQLEVLNEDFNRQNLDSVNTPVPFRSVAGRMQLQFVLAQRDANGDPTTGVTRTQTTKTGFTDDDAIKYVSRGGADIWDRTKYLNIWVGNLGAGLLGYAQFPGSGPALSDGVVIDYTAFGRVGTAQSPFNKGRTATHEVGHWLSLYHIWGDEPACVDDDLVADTPMQQDENFGCPTFPLTSGTGAACPGVNTNGAMFMNYMDYVNDACMNMFTKGQASRVLTAISGFRPTLATSDGAQPVIVQNLDASVFRITSPFGSSCNPQFTPKVILKNKGNTTLTSVTITYSLNNGTPQTYNWTGSLATFATTEITLPVQLVGPGNNTFTAATSLPNGLTDNDALNDAQTVTFVTTPPVAGLNLPYTESFECPNCPTFPYPGFTLNNPDNDLTWEITTAAKHGSKAVFVNNYDYYYIGEADELVFNALNLASAGSPELSFQVAYTPTYFGSAYGDTLEVLASVDCGQTFASLYKKSGQALSTAPPTFSPFTPTASQWRLETVPLTSLATQTNVVLKFRHTTGYENNLYLDDIRVAGALGIKPTENRALFSIFPNPTSGLLTLETSTLIGAEATVSVKNAIGQEVFRQKVNRGESGLKIDLRGKPAGMYLVQLNLGTETLTRKIVLAE
jgi:hypothetical protein